MKEKVNKFINTLEEYGDMYFSQGSIKKRLRVYHKYIKISRILQRLRIQILFR